MASIFLSGTYLLWKSAGWKLAEWKELEAAECLANAKRQHHFDCNQRTCNTTVLSMLPKLRETITKLVDSESLVKEIKSRYSFKLSKFLRHIILLDATEFILKHGCVWKGWRGHIHCEDLLSL